MNIEGDPINWGYSPVTEAHFEALTPRAGIRRPISRFLQRFIDALSGPPVYREARRIRELYVSGKRSLAEAYEEMDGLTNQGMFEKGELEEAFRRVRL